MTFCWDWHLPVLPFVNLWPCCAPLASPSPLSPALLPAVQITELSDTASREWSIEKALDKMMTDWEGLAFELGPWKETGGRGGRTGG